MSAPPEKRSRSGPVSRVLSARRPNGLASMTAISLGRRLPGASCGLPERRFGPGRSVRVLPRACALLGLAPGGVCRASRVASAAGALLPHRFTLTAAQFAEQAKPAHDLTGARKSRGGLLSVALSRALRPVDVIDHPALWSPDFPLLTFRNATEGVPYNQQRPSGPLRDQLHDISMEAEGLDAL